MKKLLSICLAGLMLFGFGAEAMAEEGESTVDWDDFYIVTQPRELTVPYGESFTLSVEVNIPEGARIVSFVWRPYIGTLGAGAEQVLRLSPGDFFYPEAYRPYYPASESYYCIITAIEEDAQGNPVGSPRELWSSSAYVTVLAERDMNFWESIRESWTHTAAGLFLYAYVGAMWFFSILLTPYYLMKDLFA